MKTPIEVVIEVDPFLGKVRVRAIRAKGANKGLMRAFLGTVEHAAHLYTLKERMQRGFKLTDCRHPRKLLKRTKAGTFCVKCGARMETKRIRQRAAPVIEIKRRLASAPVVRRLAHGEIP